MAGVTCLLSIPASAQHISLQTAPPVVVRTVPVAGATDVDPGLKEIRVTFSKPMADGNWSWSTWGEENYPEGAGDPHYLPDGRTCGLPVKLRPDKFYAIWLNSDKFQNFTDDAGRPAVPYLLTFVTGKAGAGAGGGGMGGLEGGGGVASAKTDRVAPAATSGGGGFGGGGLSGGGGSAEGAGKAGAGAGGGGMGGLGGGGGGASAKTDRVAPAATSGGGGFGGGGLSGGGGSAGGAGPDQPLNDQQRLVLAWTDRQFASFFDGRKFDGWSEPERAELETKSLEALTGPHNGEYYQGIGTLAALRSQKAVQPLLAIAADRAEKDCRDRWMAIRALGIIEAKQVVPELIPLVYHGNLNTRWWAQISLVRLTGQNFGSDWEAWTKWWNSQNGQPPVKSETIRWWSEQPEPEKLAETLAASDRKFLQDINPNPPAGENSAESAATSPSRQ
jgi:hypothetical protein